MRTLFLAASAIVVLVALPGRAEAQIGSCVPGTAVQIEYQGGWLPGRVLSTMDAAGTCLISWDGYPANWNERVAVRRIRPAAGPQTGAPRQPSATAAGPPAPSVRPSNPVAPPNPPPSRQLDGGGGCVPGQRIEIEYYGSWRLGTVKAAPDASGNCLVSWDGYSSAFDERVPLTRVRIPGQQQPLQRLPAVSSELRLGNYVCTRAGGSISPAFGFTVHPGRRYTDHQGRGGGTYRIDSAARTITFFGGGWDGRSGRFTPAESVFTHYQDGREIVTCRPINSSRG
jgi:hypothetical protein